MRTFIAFIGLAAMLGVGAMAHSGVGIGAPAARSPALLTYVASTGGLCAVRADGSHPQRLTPTWRLHGPTWSPRGAYVAFSRATGSGQSKIFVATARGKIVSRFGSATYNGGPLWSPDGRRIQYWGSWAHIYGLMVAAPDGSRDGEVAGSSAWPTYGPANPAWSADDSGSHSPTEMTSPFRRASTASDSRAPSGGCWSGVPTTLPTRPTGRNSPSCASHVQGSAASS